MLPLGHRLRVVLCRILPHVGRLAPAYCRLSPVAGRLSLANLPPVVCRCVGRLFDLVVLRVCRVSLGVCRPLLSLVGPCACGQSRVASRLSPLTFDFSPGFFCVCMFACVLDCLSVRLSDQAAYVVAHFLLRELVSISYTVGFYSGHILMAFSVC